MSQFVFLPDRGSSKPKALAGFLAAVEAGPANLALASAGNPWGSGPREARLAVLDKAETAGIALVETVDGSEPPASVAQGTLNPVVTYSMAIAEPRSQRLKLAQSLGPTGGEMFTLFLRCSQKKIPIPGAVVQLRLKNSQREIGAVSDADGRLFFGLRAPQVSDAVLLVEPGFQGHWGHFDMAANLSSGSTVDVDPVDLTTSPDVLRKLLAVGRPEDGAGVVVGVIDTGVGPHPHLPNATGDTDSSFGHGTHVAGIIAGRGTAGYAGVAPGADIRSYRVFDDKKNGVARNWEIHQAIVKAVEEGCHLINLSLKSEFSTDLSRMDNVLAYAIEDAADKGVLCIAAAGNDFRKNVAFPARHPDVLAVSALGSERGMSARAYDHWTVSRDRGKPDRDLYFANFSNRGVSGTSVDLIAPGAGVVSTVPGGGYAPMSGTSMACPAATGAIARVISRSPEMLSLPPTRARRDAMVNAASAALTKFGFVAEFEGGGMVA